METILEKYFREHDMKYFLSSDAHHNIEGDTYLRYVNQAGKTQLWFGGNNGEVCIYVTNNPEKLESIIKAIIY